MSSPGRKKVNRPRTSGNRGAKWALLIALVLVVALVVVLARLTADRNSQSATAEGPQTDTRSVKKEPEKAPVSPDAEFQFYTLLPEQGNQPPATTPPSSKQVPEPPSSTTLDAENGYLIQAGSFNQAKDAEARKAALALLGVESRVTTVTVDQRRYHRVILGPLAGKDVAAVRRQLDEAGIETTSPRRAPAR